MANELLSLPVSAGTLALAGGSVAAICRKVRAAVSPEKLPLMGILGAFVFAAQMVNFQLPLMPGTSGHMVGAVLLSIILGPSLASVVMASIIIVQCLVFQDGGLLALGCNIINMGLVPCFIGYGIFAAAKKLRAGVFASAMIACFVAVELGAMLVALEASLSGILLVPVRTFLFTMLGVHAVIGVVEGLLTIAVLAYIQQVRPDAALCDIGGTVRLTKRAMIITLASATLVVGAGLSLLASAMPDGLEWSYSSRSDTAIIKNESQAVVAADSLQQKYTPMPDYSKRLPEGAHEKAGAGWTSFAAVLGSALVMGIIYAAGRLLHRRQTAAV